MINNESKNEETNTFGLDFPLFIENIPLWEVNQFIIDEPGFRFESIKLDTTSLNNINVNKNVQLEESEYINANTREKSNVFIVTKKMIKKEGKAKMKLAFLLIMVIINIIQIIFEQKSKYILFLLYYQL